MPYTMEDYERDVAERVLRKLTPEQRLAGLPLEEIENYLRQKKAAPDSPAPE